ncbi:MAG: hypothetical protein LBI27_06005 [Clostridiales bacterium]|jgi:hypothetical protein|nr:hypothetical protein [Clostridiales bacterium]
MTKTFDNLAQRGVNYFLETMPSFRAADSAFASEKEQENAYNFIKNIYKKIYDDPTIIGFKISPDDFIPNPWYPSRDKPGVYNAVRNCIKKINIFVETIFKVILLGEANGDKILLANNYKISALMLRKFSAFEIESEKTENGIVFSFPKNTLHGLKLLANISNEHAKNSATEFHNKMRTSFLLFSHGAFNPDFMAEVFRNVFENKEAFDKTVEYFENNGFIKVENKHYQSGINGDFATLDYVKFFGKPKDYIDGAWKSNYILGIEFKYNESAQIPTMISLHIPNLRKVFQNADKMSDGVKDFVSRYNNCNGCGYCNQMNKERPIRFVKVGEKNICTVFAFGFTWNHFFGDLWFPNEIIPLMEFIQTSDIF